MLKPHAVMVIYLIIEDKGFVVSQWVAMKILTNYRGQALSSLSHICGDAADKETCA